MLGEMVGSVKWNSLSHFPSWKDDVICMSDEHFIATQLFKHASNHGIFFIFETNCNTPCYESFDYVH
jgi:hypothetical protein